MTIGSSEPIFWIYDRSTISGIHTSMNHSFFDRSYFEDGIVTGKSCYFNYHWLPELTIPMVFWMMNELSINPGDKVLDYGCSKGYMVKAMRLLGVDAKGVDISEYAIKNCDKDVSSYCRLITDSDPTPWKEHFDWVITKDVLEHMSTSDIENFFYHYSALSDQQYHIIPLGDNGRYRIQQYHMDPSHIQINNENWWVDFFRENGWNKVSVKHHVRGIKDNWHKIHTTGNGFFRLSKDA